MACFQSVSNFLTEPAVDIHAVFVRERTGGGYALPERPAAAWWQETRGAVPAHRSLDHPAMNGNQSAGALPYSVGQVGGCKTVYTRASGNGGGGAMAVAIGALIFVALIGSHVALSLGCRTG